ncbi:tetracycline resistance MFS efflux pump [Dactylosporangium aurantiacum]|uniref:Tetracycline resistance MFS efflux pump n=1 Tax=Dactylosporangium aurantiacum TaxID=35754 RepID=A0A9Q9MJJ2_9ACTN|nr:tetracycline resistance MFS efflux pump [Dactylosporangium aurantiacum]MDG6108681.1 tetracycline resistance MFS efflux pump [Dactylosporangium aurantiacum]UWZ59109.1 tetracycline resistance MFS efflux pump [Dactylosporangium aurantiacum]
MRRAPALSFLLVTVFIDMLGLGLIVPIAPALLTGVTGDPAAGARWSGVIGSSYGLLQFLASPLLGRLCDRYGRRPVLLASLACLGVDYLAHAVSPTAWLLLLFHAVAGACAGTNTVVNAYIADVTPPQRRARAYGLVGTAFGLGFVAGPTIGGLLGAVDVRLPFHAAAALALANVAYGALILPESRPGDRRTPLTLRTVNPVGAIAAVLRRPVLGRLTYARALADVARMTSQVCWTFFVTARFGWGTAQVGVVMAAGALAGAAFQARLVGPLARRLGDKRAAVLGGLLAAVSFAGTAAAAAPWVLYALQAVGVLASVGGAAAQSWLSGATGDDEQGTVQGAVTGIGALAETAVPVVATAVFAWSLAHGSPGLVFLGAAACAAASTVLLATTPPATPPAAPGP